MNNDRIWELYSSINEWVRYADAKAGIALGAHAAIFTVAIPGIIENRVYFTENTPIMSAVILATAFAVVSSYFGIRCVVPRLNVGEARSLIFFAHIAKGYSDSVSFRNHAAKHYNDDDGFFNQVLDQVWANSRVAWEKHKDSTYCFRWLIAQAAVAVCGFLWALLFVK